MLFLTNVMCEDYGNYPDLRNVNKSQSIAESIVTNRINITAWWINVRPDKLYLLVPRSHVCM